MDVTHKRIQVDGSVGADAPPRRDSDTALSLTRAPLALLRLQPGRAYLRSVEIAVADGRAPVAASRLVIRRERRRNMLIIWLSGVLNRATATVLERELDARAIGTIPIIVDLTGLELIDSPGLDALVRRYRRKTERAERVSFRHGQHVAQRPDGLVRGVQKRSQRAPRSARLGDEDSYFALAMACADVDPLPRGDRPGQP